MWWYIIDISISVSAYLNRYIEVSVYDSKLPLRHCCCCHFILLFICFAFENGRNRTLYFKSRQFIRFQKVVYIYMLSLSICIIKQNWIHLIHILEEWNCRVFDQMFTILFPFPNNSQANFSFYEYMNIECRKLRNHWIIDKCIQDMKIE